MRYSRRTLNRIRIFIVKTITAIMGIIFILCMCAADSEQLMPVVILMLISGGWLHLVAYANGWVTDTEPWYEREERERKRRERYDLQ